MPLRCPWARSAQPATHQNTLCTRRDSSPPSHLRLRPHRPTDLPTTQHRQATMNRLLFGLFAVAACLQGALSSTTIETDNDVLVLTDANFDKAIKVGVAV